MTLIVTLEEVRKIVADNLKERGFKIAGEGEIVYVTRGQYEETVQEMSGIQFKVEG